MSDELRSDAVDLGGAVDRPVRDLSTPAASMTAEKQPNKMDRWPLWRVILFWCALTVSMWLVIIGVARLVGGEWML
jgi:hypothetical protein